MYIRQTQASLHNTTEHWLFSLLSPGWSKEGIKGHLFQKLKFKSPSFNMNFFYTI